MTYFNLKKCIIPAVLAAAVIIPMTSQADVVISGTRVIYQQKNKDVTVRLDNKGNKPLLVQSWLDDGREGVNPQELNVPFVITPPISRIDPKRGQTVRITSLGGNLAKDRESVYWFNVLEVPPKAKGAETGNTMQLAFRTRIKFFYRPEGLKGDSAVAAQSLKWSAAGAGAVEAKNDSNYYVSLNSASLTVGGKKYSVETQMVSPHSSLKMAVKGLSASAAGNKLTYSAINDFGGAINKDVTL